MTERSGQNIKAPGCCKKDPSNNERNQNSKNMTEVTKPTSLSSLILWNISKAKEKNPAMDIKSAIKAAQGRLESERDISAMIPDSAEQKHLACAVLAWQQLGHNDIDRLFAFIENKSKTKQCTPAQLKDSTPVEVINSHESKYSKDVQSMSFGSSTVGPVVKLPVDTKIVMRMDNSPSVRQPAKKPRAQEKDTMNKIEAACCIDSACAERLAKMDTATTELRMRAGMLARREAERVELLERAEGAWRDLELGYQRRLTLTEEKEEDLTKQIQKAIEERNEFKNACTTLAARLREIGDKAEKERAALSLVEKELCERACLRLKLSEESAQTDAILAEHQCRAAQLDRDLQFKEEQARRKLLNFQSELESSQTLTHETERAMRAELSALREQIEQVSQQLLGEDTDNAQIQQELENLRQEKMNMIEDLEGCKATCDSRLQGKFDDLKKKREQLAELKEKVMDCRCKLPVDATVEVKRTASLAALCQCTPEEKILESCSCTSLRSRLLSDLLGDLFSGLQSEMSGTGTEMPCQLLKCLEDRHNWDRASIVKTNLKDYFSQLLIGELDIAIATSIEKYHAKWVGKSCADAARMIPDPGEQENEGWQERLIERRAQKLATKLAEQLFKSRADELTQRAKDIVSSGPPPCECKPQAVKAAKTESVRACAKEGAAAVYPVLVRPLSMSPAPVNGPTTPANTPAYWRQTMQDVTQLRVQIEDLKKDSIKKEDLKLMEQKITKIVQRGSGTGKSDFRQETVISSNIPNDAFAKKEAKINRAVNSNQPNYYMNVGRPPSYLKKKQIETNSCHKKIAKPSNIQSNGSDKPPKSCKKLGQTYYAINMCICSQKDPNKLNLQNRIPTDSVIEENGRNDNISILQMTNSVRQTKPINSSLQSQDISTRSISKSSGQKLCQSNCKCFHKIPSNTSIDKLLETLAKWKSDLNPCKTEKECENDIPCCNFLLGSEISPLNYKTQLQNESNLICCGNDTENRNTCPFDTAQKNTVPDIEEESTNSKILSRPNVFAENTDQINSCQSPGVDKQSAINSKSSAKTLRNQYVNSNIVNKNTNTHPNDMESHFIAPTESEYMGAINLDKSNEDFCKCLAKTEAPSNPTNELYKCMPCKCSCKSLKTRKNYNNECGLEKPKASVTTTNNAQKNISLERIPQKNENNQSNKVKSDIFPCDCGYDIEFLGVTLTDVTTTDQRKPLYDEKEDQLKERCEKKTGCCNPAGQHSGKIGSAERDKREKHIASSNIETKGDKKKKEKEDKYKQHIRDRNIKDRASTEERTSSNSTEDSFSNHEIEKNCIRKTNDSTNIIAVTRVENREICDKCNLYKRKKINGESCPLDTPSCECKVSFDEFRNYIDVAFQNQLTNDDKGLDVQSFKDSKIEEESCICCNKKPLDDSQDLEENTFHLLEEHLKKKLEEFKETSCNSTCIPPEEEEKLFTTILKRVKQVITDSTNNIACKCANQEENSKGSWTRAYGLLQEYLKTKIQRAQCACVSSEDKSNNDTILPEVLGKVCNLIENDFQRLKDVCGCKKSEIKDSKQVGFKLETPERDNNIPNTENNNSKNKYCCSQNPQTSINKENNSSQVPAYLGMETKFCDPLETYTKNVQTLERAQEISKVDTTSNCNCCEKKVDAELLGTIETKKSTELSNNNGSKTKPAQFSNTPYIAYASECVCKNIECTNTDVLRKRISDQIDGIKAISMPNKPIQNNKIVENTSGSLKNKGSASVTQLRTRCGIVELNTDTELVVVNESKTGQTIDLKKKKCKCDLANSASCCQKNDNYKLTDAKFENVTHFPNKPYIGYTLDCSCNTALGACICTKTTVQAATDAMDSIMKKSMPNEKYYEKVSYIMKSNPTDNANYHNDLLSEMTGDLYLHNLLKHKTLYEDDTKQDCETEAGVSDRENIILKNSRDFFETAHTTTNTYDDNASLDTDYSNTEAALDWCECCSQVPPREINSNILKQSLHIPVPLAHDNVSASNIKTDKSEIIPKLLLKYCECDLVPICHVKMLVENIENKLASAKCTCDSMIPKVCPIHSTSF